MIPLTVPLPVATPATAETKGFLTVLGAQVEMQGGLICNHKSVMETSVSPGVMACQTDAQRAALWHAISNM
ncbi:hypothetical protein Tco_0724654 [Tanacetum coccineum]